MCEFFMSRLETRHPLKVEKKKNWLEGDCVTNYRFLKSAQAKNLLVARSAVMQERMEKLKMA